MALTNEELKKTFTNFYHLLEMKKESQTKLEDGIVTLICKDGQCIAHKTFLTSCSEYFDAMFRADNMETRTYTVSFPDISTEIMSIVVKYVYAQELPDPSDISKELNQDLLIVSNRLLMDKLFDKYWESFTDDIDLSNFLNVWSLSLLLDKQEIVPKVESFVVNNFKEISKTADLAEITTEKIEGLIVSDVTMKLNDGKYSDLIYFIFDWGLKKENMDEVPNLLSKYDFSRLYDVYITDLLKREVVTQREELKTFFTNEISRRWTESIKPQLLLCTLHMTDNLTHCRRKISIPQGHEIYERIYPRMAMSSAMWNGFMFTYTPDFLASIQLEDGRKIVYQTANKDEMFFFIPDGNRCYIKFNFKTKEWSSLTDPEILYSKRLLLVADGKFYMEDSDRAIKIFDSTTRRTEYREKPSHSLWKCFDCPSRNLDAKKNVCIYFYNIHNKKLAIYETKNDCWTVMDAYQLLNIRYEKVDFFSYENSLIVSLSHQVVYSLQTRKRIRLLTALSSATMFDICWNLE